MKQIYLCLSLLVIQLNALVVPNKTHFPGKHLERISRHLIEPNISNGDLTFMAVIIHGDCDHLCGGVFLTHRSILTFANCVVSEKAKIKVYPNIPYYLPHCDEDYTLYPIAKVLFMPGYNSGAQKDLTSLAIIHLEKPVIKVKTIPINHVSHSGLKEETILFNLGINRQLHVDDFDDLQKCETLWPEESPAICGSLRDENEPHKCTLVPGLPLINNVNGQTYLKGLLIDPLSCPPKDVVYVNVTSHLTWILSEIKPVNSNSDLNLSNGTFAMRQVTFPPFSPDTPVQKSWPLGSTEHRHAYNTDNSKHNVSVHHMGQNCNCSCKSYRSNNSYPLYGDEKDTLINERSNNNNNNNNNNAHGTVLNSNQNNYD